MEVRLVVFIDIILVPDDMADTLGVRAIAVRMDGDIIKIGLPSLSYTFDQIAFSMWGRIEVWSPETIDLRITTMQDH